MLTLPSSNVARPKVLGGVFCFQDLLQLHGIQLSFWGLDSWIEVQLISDMLALDQIQDKFQWLISAKLISQEK